VRDRKRNQEPSDDTREEIENLNRIKLVKFIEKYSLIDGRRRGSAGLGAGL
jgi:hypothetical protein